MILACTFTTDLKLKIRLTVNEGLGRFLWGKMKVCDSGANPPA